MHVMHIYTQITNNDDELIAPRCAQFKSCNHGFQGYLSWFNLAHWSPMKMFSNYLENLFLKFQYHHKI